VYWFAGLMVPGALLRVCGLLFWMRKPVSETLVLFCARVVVTPVVSVSRAAVASMLVRMDGPCV
jgi:hypothetical protein